MCIVALKSNTYAQKAKKILFKQGIKAEILRLEPYKTKNGCSYGVSFPCESQFHVEFYLKQSNINYSEILREQ